MTTPQPAKKPIYKRWWFIALAVFFALGIIGNIVSDPEATDTAAEETTVAETTVEETPKVVEEESPTPEEESPVEESPAEERPLPPGIEPDPRCVSNEDLAAYLSGAITDESLSVQNVQVVEDGDDMWIGASLVRPDGEFESRSDVWLQQGGALYAVSGGARNNSMAVSHPDPAYSMANDIAHGVDSCVVVATLNR